MSQKQKDNPDSNDPLVLARENRVMIKDFKKMFDEFKNNDFKSLSQKVDKISDSLSKRPTWFFTVVFWILSSGLVATIMYIATGGRLGG